MPVTRRVVGRGPVFLTVLASGSGMAHVEQAGAVGVPYGDPAGAGQIGVAVAAVTLLPALLVAGLYAVGTLRVWRRSGFGKGIRRWQMLSFYGGLLALAAAVATPLDTLAHTLFAGHMAQHMLLVLLAAPLLVCGAPTVPLLWALPRRGRLAVGRWWRRSSRTRTVLAWLSQPLVAWFLFALALWVWHLPRLYQLAVVDPIVHALEHATLILASCLFWWLVIQPLGRRRLSHGAAILFVFTASLQVTMLGAVLSMAPEPLYPVYAAGAAAWDLPLLDDQRLAAVVMRTPMAFAFLATVSALFLRWLVVMERRASGRRGAG